MIETSRRSLLTGLGALIAAPAIVRASSLMPLKAVPNWDDYDEALRAIRWNEAYAAEYTQRLVRSPLLVQWEEVASVNLAPGAVNYVPCGVRQLAAPIEVVKPQPRG
jgi:hypothetical protein